MELRRAVPATDAHLAQAVDALFDGEELREHVESRDEHVVPVRHDFAPPRPVACRTDVGFADPEVARLPVGPYHPAPADVIDRVLVATLARQQHLETQLGIVGTRVADLRGDRAARVDQEVTAILRHLDGGVERLVLLLVQQRVRGWIRAEHVDADAQAEQRDRVLLDVQDASVVGGPGHRLVHIRHGVRQQCAGLQRLEPQRVLATTDRVLGVREQAVVVARLERTEVVEVESPGLLAQVEQDLLGRIDLSRPARVDGVFVAGLEAAVIPVAVVPVRDGRIVLADAADDFGVERFLERAQPRRERLAVGVLGLQVLEHLRRRARVVAQPVIVVEPHALRRTNLVRFAGGDRRRRTLAHVVIPRPDPCAPDGSAVCPRTGSTASSSVPARSGAAAGSRRSGAC